MVSNLDDNNKDVQDTTEIMEDNGLFKSKICGVKFDNASAYEGHIVAGHLTPSPLCLIELVKLYSSDFSHNSLRIYGGRETEI